MLSGNYQQEWHGWQFRKLAVYISFNHCVVVGREFVASFGGSQSDDENGEFWDHHPQIYMSRLTCEGYSIQPFGIGKIIAINTVITVVESNNASLNSDHYNSQ